MSIFQNIQQAPAIEVYALGEAYLQDTSAEKVDLTVGAYRADNGKPWTLPVVQAVEVQLASDLNISKELLPATGAPTYTQSALSLIFGQHHTLLEQNLVSSIQTVGGTGALYLAMALLQCHLNKEVVYVSKPTWGNHKGIAQQLGYQVREYRYLDTQSRGVDFCGLLEDLRSAPEGSVVILHACAHNPTGVDLTHEQWTLLAHVFKEKHHFPLFDFAYQGFASGDLDTDAWSVRYFADCGFDFMVAQAFSKNFGLYNERVGHLAIVCQDPQTLAEMQVQVEQHIPNVYLSPPAHGARIVSAVLNDPSLFEEWKSNIKTMSSRVKLMRQLLYHKMVSLGTPGSWKHIVEQIGIFFYSGLTDRQIELLRTKFHVYALSDGRINMCGVNSSNVDHVAEAIHSVVCAANP